MTNRYFTPLRYPGGKAKLTWLFRDLLRLNNFKNAVYIEPYAGGAGIGLELLLRNEVSCIYINDLNLGVYSFWYAVLHETEDLCKRIAECSLNIDVWKEQKATIAAMSSTYSIELAFAFFYLNRTNRSGIINGGVIGGHQQNGNYKMDARFNKTALIDRIKRIAIEKGRISLTNLDAELFIKTNSIINNPESITYIDPPYFKQGKRLYDNFYTESDHARIANSISTMKGAWILSYDKNVTIEDLYKSYNTRALKVGYSATKRTLGNELLFFSNSLAIPNSFESKSKMTLLEE